MPVLAAAILWLSLGGPSGPDEPPAPRRISPASAPRRSDTEPALPGVAAWTAAVLALVGGAAWAARRALRGTRLALPDGSITLLGRRPLGARQDLYLVGVGRRVLLIGSTREGLVTLGDFPKEDAGGGADVPKV